MFLNRLGSKHRNILNMLLFFSLKFLNINSLCEIGILSIAMFLDFLNFWPSQAFHYYMVCSYKKTYEKKRVKRT